jgi:hypothetical protein
LIDHSADERVEICQRMRQAPLVYLEHRAALQTLAGFIDDSERTPPREQLN